eukprot:gnl/TRDRNA2_/TRDRNA2_194432_c0_seq1.p1 gnl/TRDRNA2_/TRDRNA2_194432_c0~~gnl/TRDRNA2_/TRDRNA2_194432_c0_seq1.p1  ORF type:complete len:471 (+),score=81.34 gnl/TRDRNA2_/TRDRNA2_194432_c0_seq1:34-1446(+)
MAQVLAAELRVKGNALYSKGNIRLAVDCYVEGVEAWEEAAVAAPRVKALKEGDVVRYDKGRWGTVDVSYPIMGEYLIKDIYRDEVLWQAGMKGMPRHFARDELQAISPDLFRLRIAFLQNLAAASVKLGEFRDAVAWADAALLMDPKSTKALTRKGAGFLHLGKFDKAEKALNAAYEGAPVNREVVRLLRLARTALRSKYRNAAMQRVALNLPPEVCDCGAVTCDLTPPKKALPPKKVSETPARKPAAKAPATGSASLPKCGDAACRDSSCVEPTAEKPQSSKALPKPGDAACRDAKPAAVASISSSQASSSSTAVAKQDPRPPSAPVSSRGPSETCGDHGSVAGHGEARESSDEHGCDCCDGHGHDEHGDGHSSLSGHGAGRGHGSHRDDAIEVRVSSESTARFRERSAARPVLTDSEEEDEEAAAVAATTVPLWAGAGALVAAAATTLGAVWWALNAGTAARLVSQEL